MMPPSLAKRSQPVVLTSNSSSNKTDPEGGGVADVGVGEQETRSKRKEARSSIFKGKLLATGGNAGVKDEDESCDALMDGILSWAYPGTVRPTVPQGGCAIE